MNPTIKCKTCKEQKPRDKFNSSTGKGRTQKCDDCKTDKRSRSILTKKCRRCKKQVSKTLYEMTPSGRLRDSCNNCFGFRKERTKGVTKVNPLSFEAQQQEILTAKEVLAKMKSKEAEIIKSGSFVRELGDIRSIILRKV